jgi:O-antigen/teichoic acid export membrane protein
MLKRLLVTSLGILLLHIPLTVFGDGLARVYYAGPDGAVRTALGIAASLEIVEDARLADVLVLNGVAPNPGELAARIRSGAGLVLIGGSDLTSETAGILLDQPVALEILTEPLSLTDVEGMEDPALRQIVWKSSPQIRNRSAIHTAGFDSLVTGYPDESLVLGKAGPGQNRIFYFAAFLDGSNPQIQDWPYFNYLIYQLATRAAGQQALSFADYPGSPVPHPHQRNILFAFLAAVLVTAWTIFWFVRRYSSAHPELLDVLVARPKEFTVRQASTDWNEVGFHRPLGGFLLALVIALFMSLPMIIYNTMILRVYILPSAQALGIYGRVTQFFSLIWVIFDVGTAIAFVKFFAQYRVDDPARAIKYGQLFVWWQALTGTLQIALVTVVAGIWMPHTVYALYAWISIAHCMIQIPGFYMLFRHALAGWQRFDYVQIMQLAMVLLFPLLTQPFIVIAMVAWGKSEPTIGASMGGMYGMAISAYVSQVLAFLLGFFLFKRLGFSVKILFLAHFDLKVIKETFRFGVFEMLGSGAFTAGQAFEIAISYAVLMTLYGNLMPSISEAISHGRRKLSQYYAAMAHKWGGFISGFYCAMLLAVADRFILGATGPEFDRAAAYVIPLVIYHALTFPTWVSDQVALGANRPYIKTMLTVAEQLVRILLVIVLIERFQIYALVMAYMVAILLKNFSAYWIVNKYCFAQRYFVWQTLAAPILAGVLHYSLLRWLTGMVWQGGPLTSLLIYVIGLIPSFPVYAFFYGVFGGWDDDGLADFRRGVELSNFARPIAWILWKASDAGARISPLHGMFPISVYGEAMADARSLTVERVGIVGQED